jgi:hypothetical protein
MMNNRGAWILLAVLLVVFGGVFPRGYGNIGNHHASDVHISVAVYDSVIKDYAMEAIHPLNFSWCNQGYTYHLDPVVITRGDIMKRDTIFTRENFDVLVIPGSGRPYVDAFHPKWKDRVREFVDQGGGFLGICGGANLASQGFQEKKGLNGILNHSVLGIANVYVNNQQNEEWMYLWKANWQQGLPPIDIYFTSNNNPIFEDVQGNVRNIRYGGGPGMYMAPSVTEKQGLVIPLALYAQEPMTIAPLHYWIWDHGWQIQKDITTDIKGQYAVVATSYGKGRIVLFGPHPEKKTFFGGYITEFPVRPNMGPFTWHIYNWDGGVSSSREYNWWMIQRAAAWISQKVPTNHLPPAG